MRISILLSKSDKQQCRGRRVPIFYAELLAHQEGHVDAVRFVVPCFMVSRHYAENLSLDRFKEFLTGIQFVHRCCRCPVCIADARCDGTIHEVTVQHAEHIIVCADVFDVLHDLLVVALRVTPVIIRYRDNLNLLEIRREIHLNRLQDCNT